MGRVQMVIHMRKRETSTVKQAAYKAQHAVCVRETKYMNSPNIKSVLRSGI